MKTILGLDLGTNSIGWALIENNDTDNTGKIIATGSRILPMSQDILGKFDSGQSVPQTAERTGFRGVRRLRERHLLRRERLHRVLNIIGFLPGHYAKEIDFEKHFGQFIPETEPKIAYFFNNESGKFEFLFKNSFNEMLCDFASLQPELVANNKLIPYDWTIYYLRKKALTQKIEKEELAWLLLNFNQKRGYYQLRGEDEEENNKKLEEFFSLKVIKVEATDNKKGKDEIWYNVFLENGLIYRRTSKTHLDWEGKIKDFIITTELNDDGTVKKDKEGKEKRSFRAPADDDWGLRKKKTEHEIDISKKTVGEYIYDTLLQNPEQKINGKLVRVIERKFYKTELDAILKTQQEFHKELKNTELYNACLEELYEHNEAHKNNINQKDFKYLFLNDILFYQRPLKTKKSLISNCKFESRCFKKDGKKEFEPIKCIAKSHPLYQEFRLWQFIQNLKIYEKEKSVNTKSNSLFGEENSTKIETDVDVTSGFIKNEDDLINLFDWLNNRKEVDQKAFLGYPAFNIKKNKDNYRWNYVEDKMYPCNETLALIKSKLEKVANVPSNFLKKDTETALWHILYSVEDKEEIQKALKTFAQKNGLGEDFAEQFKKCKPFEKEYGAYSAKAIKRLLPLMRMGKYWNEDDIINNINNYQLNIQNVIANLKRENKNKDGNINTNLLSKLENLADDISAYKGIDHYLASYVVYGKHSEDGEAKYWKTANDIQLLQQHSLRNPIVEQVINETLQTVKDIWKQHGNGEENYFGEIHIELGREMKNPAKDREKMTKQITENENTNLRIKALLAELINDVDIESVRPYSPYQQEILKIYEEGVINSEENIPEDILKITKLAQPTKSELIRYKLWLEQKYRSPYTGEMIPLTKLFTSAYEIEHIIPQSRFYDDSFSNKVICETVVNGQYYKANRTGYEFIKEFKGQIVTELSTDYKTVKLFTIEEYELFVKEHYGNLRGKMKKLLMEELPEKFVERQLNDTRYISKVVKNLMSNIVRENGEQEAISKNVIVGNGTITSILKQDWGLNDIWNDLITPRFERMNKITGSTNYGEWTIKEGKIVFQTQVPLQLQKGFSKKRIDHRHHALDAIVIACATRNHINYLNNASAIGKDKKENKEKKRNDLRHILCLKKYNDNTKQGYKWVFKKPWETFTQDTGEKLSSTVVSFKQNLRVINKTINRPIKYIKHEDGSFKKDFTHQKMGQNWAIRKPMHKDTVSGLIKLKFKKVVSFAIALDNWEMIVDKGFKMHIKYFIDKKYEKKKIIDLFRERKYEWKDKNYARVEIYYWDNENVASRVKIDDTFNAAKIDTITDTGIQKIMLLHLQLQNEEKDGKIIEHPEIAFSPDGIDELNKNIVTLNNSKPHKPIIKVRTYEPKGNKFAVGETGNKKDKYVEAAKGTNLFFAIYVDDKGKRNYDTIPMNIVIERQKQGLLSVPELNEAGHKLLFWLSPNDLVYVPNNEEQTNTQLIDFKNLSIEQVKGVYKMVSSTGFQCFFVRHDIATTIINKVEFSPLNKMEKSIEGIMIKEACIKLNVDRLGNVRPA